MPHACGVTHNAVHTSGRVLTDSLVKCFASESSSIPPQGYKQYNNMKRERDWDRERDRDRDRDRDRGHDSGRGRSDKPRLLNLPSYPATKKWLVNVGVTLRLNEKSVLALMDAHPADVCLVLRDFFKGEAEGDWPLRNALVARKLNLIENRCVGCGKKSGLKRCCGSIQYCSETCQNNDWDLHKKDCNRGSGDKRGPGRDRDRDRDRGADREREKGPDRDKDKEREKDQRQRLTTRVEKKIEKSNDTKEEGPKKALPPARPPRITHTPQFTSRLSFLEEADASVNAAVKEIEEQEAKAKEEGENGTNTTTQPEPEPEPEAETAQEAEAASPENSDASESSEEDFLAEE